MSRGITNDLPLVIPASLSAERIGWQWVRLSEVCEGVFDCPHSTPVLASQGPLVVRSQDIRTGRLRSEQAAHVSESVYQERISRAEPHEGDILFSREGTYFGIAAEVPPGVRLCLGQRMVLLRPDSSIVNFRYLRCWLNSEVLGIHMEGFHDGSVAQRLNVSTIRALPVMLPPRGVQDEIARTMGALEDKVDVNERLLLTLDKLSRGLYRSWFVDYEPVRRNIDKPETDALFPDSFTETSLGQVPTGWTAGSLDELATNTRGRSYRSDELQESDTALVTLKSFQRGGGYRQDGLKGYVGVFRPEQVLEAGDIVLACTDVTQDAEVIGRAARVVPSDEYSRLVASLDALIVKPKKNTPKAFLFEVLRSDDFVAHALAYTNGTTVLHLDHTALRTYQLAIPTQEILDAFGRVADPMFERALLCERETSALLRLKEIVLRALLAGDIETAEAVDAVS